MGEPTVPLDYHWALVQLLVIVVDVYDLERIEKPHQAIEIDAHLLLQLEHVIGLEQIHLGLDQFFSYGLRKVLLVALEFHQRLLAQVLPVSAGEEPVLVVKDELNLGANILGNLALIL